jgi:hypothetical protein
MFSQKLGQRLDCDKVTMCDAGFCTCASAGCDAQVTAERLTLRRVGDELVGLFQSTLFKNARGLNTTIGEVRLHLE